MFYWSQNVYKKFSRSLEQIFSHRRTEQFWKQNTSTPPPPLSFYDIEYFIIINSNYNARIHMFFASKTGKTYIRHITCVEQLRLQILFTLFFYLVRFVFFCGEIGQANCIKNSFEE